MNPDWIPPEQMAKPVGVSLRAHHEDKLDRLKHEWELPKRSHVIQKLIVDAVERLDNERQMKVLAE